MSSGRSLSTERMEEEQRCKFWLPKKKRFCANSRLGDSLFCGNHKPRSDGQWVLCPIDSSHSVLKENLEGHVRRCPLFKQSKSLTNQPFYKKAINAGSEELEEMGDSDKDVITSEMKRSYVYSLTVVQFCKLIKKIELVHAGLCEDIRDSFKMPEACNMWIRREIDRELPFQEKHVMQQVSILGNMEDFGLLKSWVGGEQCDSEVGTHGDEENVVPAVVEFGAGRGYLTQMLADCYGIKRVFLVERKSYKLKADRSLRQKKSLVLERLRIDIEDLNLNAIKSLREVLYLAIGKHLCGPATDLMLRCCLSGQCKDNGEGCGGSNFLEGLAVATCCHHLCQWKHYINKRFIINLGITKEEFHAISWFTSWAVDADHGSNILDLPNCSLHLKSIEEEQFIGSAIGIEDVVRNMRAAERAVFGFKCKQIIDMGRMIWAKEQGLDAQLVKYVPLSISPENHLLVARTVKSS